MRHAGAMSVEIPRRAQRRSVVLPAQCRTTSGLRDTGEISDISTQGCCIKTDTLLFRVGSRIVIRPDQMEALGGTVRWIAGDCAGVEFDRAIYNPILDHLVRMHETGVPVQVSRR
jgi:hypothetical protein